MGDLVHVLYSASQSNNYSEKDTSHKPEMHPVWPSRGLLLADYDFVLRKKLLDQRGHSIHVCGGKIYQKQ